MMIITMMIITIMIITIMIIKMMIVTMMIIKMMIITIMIIKMMIITMMIITKTIIIPNKGSGVEVTESVSRTTVSNLAFTTIFSPGLTKYIFNKYFRVLKQNQSYIYFMSLHTNWFY